MYVYIHMYVNTNMCVCMYHLINVHIGSEPIFEPRGERGPRRAVPPTPAQCEVFRVYVLEFFVVWCIEFGVWCMGFGVWVWGFGVWGFGFGVRGLGFGVWGSGFRV